MNASRVSPFRRYGLASRSKPSVVIGRALMPEPHIDPAPCAGCTSTTSGSGASFVVHAVVQLAGQRALDVVADQVGTAQRPDEEEVAGQQHLRHLRRAGEVVDEKRQVLGCVAGRVQRLDAGLAQRERVALAHRRVRERGLVELALVVGGDLDVGAGGLGQRLGAGGEIGVDVRFEDADDAEVSGVGEVEVDVDVAARIDDDHLALRLRSRRRRNSATGPCLRSVRGA